MEKSGINEKYNTLDSEEKDIIDSLVIFLEIKHRTSDEEKIKLLDKFTTEKKLEIIKKIVQE